MPSAKQARRNNIALANTARFSRSASAPPPAVRAVDAGALDEAELSQAGTARAVEPVAAASGAVHVGAAAESSSAALESASERSSTMASPPPLPTGDDEPMALDSDESMLDAEPEESQEAAEEDKEQPEQPEQFEQPEDAVVEAIRQLQSDNPQLGVKKLLALLQAAHPLWEIDSKLVRQALAPEPVAAPRVMLSTLPDADLFPLIRRLQLTQLTIQGRAPPSAPLDFSHGCYLVRLNLVERSVGFQVQGVNYDARVPDARFTGRGEVVLGRGASGLGTAIACVCNGAFEEAEVSDIAQRIRAGELADVDAAVARSQAAALNASELPQQPVAVVKQLLAAQVARTKEAALDRAADVAAQDEALAAREAAVAAREAAVAPREAAVDAREATVATREAALAARETGEIGVVV